MRFRETGPYEVFTNLTGEAHNPRDTARQFCNTYRRVGRKVFKAESLGLEAVFWTTGREWQDSVLRCALTQEEAPHLFQQVFECHGHDPDPMDIIVMMPEIMLSDPRLRADMWRMLPVVLMDAASALSDTAETEPGLGWAARIVTRAALCAVLTRATEFMLPVGEVESTYNEICACAVMALVEARYQCTNGEVIFVMENPGLATVIEAVVLAARSAKPLSLPLDADEALDDAVSNVSASLAETPVILTLSH